MFVEIWLNDVVFLLSSIAGSLESGEATGEFRRAASEQKPNETEGADTNSDVAFVTRKRKKVSDMETSKLER